MKNGSSSGSSVDLNELGMIGSSEKKLAHCKGCSNQCIVTKLRFDNGKVFYSGNRCERIFSNGGNAGHAGFNLAEYKEKLLFDRDYVSVDSPRIVIGIPRALNIYDNFPFWCTLFVGLGLK